MSVEECEKMQQKLNLIDIYNTFEQAKKNYHKEGVLWSVIKSTA